MYNFQNDKLNTIFQNSIKMYEDGVQTDKLQLAGSIFNEIKQRCNLNEFELFNIFIIKHFLDKEI